MHNSPAKPLEPLVLLAEDSEDDAFFFQRAFTKASVGCSLVRARTGKAAIEMLSGSASNPTSLPFVVFLDLKMPVMGGFEVLEWLESARISPRMRVIVLSGSDDYEDRARATRLGADEYLVKPITPEVLKERLLTALQSRRASVTSTAKGGGR